MGDSCVNKLLQEIQGVNVDCYEVIQAIRSLIFRMYPNVKEEIKYGGILFSVSSPFCGLFSYTKHVSLEFGNGALLQDEFNMLEGSGKQRRHIKLKTQEEISSKNVPHYLELALRTCTYYN